MRNAVSQIDLESLARRARWIRSVRFTITLFSRSSLPGLRGFSATSIKKMRQFYEKWEEFLNRSPMAGELEKAEFDIKTPIIPIHALINLNRSPWALQPTRRCLKNSNWSCPTKNCSWRQCVSRPFCRCWQNGYYIDILYSFAYISFRNSSILETVDIGLQKPVCAFAARFINHLVDVVG